MPETNECYAHWLLNTKMMEAAPENTSWHVRALWADATSAEHRSSASDSACEGESRLGQGLVQHWMPAVKPNVESLGQRMRFGLQCSYDKAVVSKGKNKRNRTFNWQMTNTRTVVVGRLECYGNARIIKTLTENTM